VRVERFGADGAPSAAINARNVLYFDHTQRFEAEGAVTADLYQANGARLTAERLVYDATEGLFTAEGRVVVLTRDGRRLESERLVWDETQGQLRVTGRFRFTTPSERISGVGLVATEDLSRYTFSQASGELEVAE
jgi:lipopolysaccharide assembly outer membrane protein LptD (OstA)